MSEAPPMPPFPMLPLCSSPQLRHSGATAHNASKSISHNQSLSLSFLRHHVPGAESLLMIADQDANPHLNATGTDPATLTANISSQHFAREWYILWDISKWQVTWKFFLWKKIDTLCVRVFCLPLCLCTTCMPGAHGGQTFTVTGRYEACQDLNLGPLEEHLVLLISGPQFGTS